MGKKGKHVTRRERILGGLWGAVVGDVLGVPVEFTDREELARRDDIDKLLDGFVERIEVEKH